MTSHRQERIHVGKHTLIDPVGTWFSVVLSFGPLGPAQYQRMCRTLTEAELYTKSMGWPVPSDELEKVIS